MKPFMSHRKGGDEREKEVRERNKSTDSSEAEVAEMDTGKRQNKTEGVALIIASRGAVTSFIFTQCEVFSFVFTAFFFLEFTTSRTSL